MTVPPPAAPQLPDPTRPIPRAVDGAEQPPRKDSWWGVVTLLALLATVLVLIPTTRSFGTGLTFWLLIAAVVWRFRVRKSTDGGRQAATFTAGLCAWSWA